MLSWRTMTLERIWDHGRVPLNVSLQSRAGTEWVGTVLEDMKLIRRSM